MNFHTLEDVDKFSDWKVIIILRGVADISERISKVSLGHLGVISVVCCNFLTLINVRSVYNIGSNCDAVYVQ
jgi:hypothetical protein